MFFIISKLISFLVSPFFWVFVLLVLGICIKKWRFKMLITATLLLFLLGNDALFSIVVRNWEPPLQPLSKINHQNRIIVVLGGYCSYSETTGRARFNESADRLWQALIVWQKSDSSKLVISGGSANVLIKARGEGAVIKEVLNDIGFDNNRVMIDSLSRSTYENAVECATLFKRYSIPMRIVLVTSAWHMKRARWCFEKQGFDVEQLTTDSFTPVEPLTVPDYLVPSLSVIGKWDRLVHEWAGIVTYKMKGYI
jgi:uncharacterized SAM-binding protein YcdF (DUF218 family)